MAHVDDGTLNALLDGELPPEDAAAVRAHLVACAECAARFEEAKRFLAEAADLLGALAPPPVEERPSAAAPPTAIPARRGDAAAAGPPARRVSKTAREVAIDIDGATHKSPAIPPNFPREGEKIPPPPPGVGVRPLFGGSAPSRAPRRATDWPTLAWAASVVLALGVGYLANEVRHAGQPAAPSEASSASQRAPAEASRSPSHAEPHPSGVGAGSGAKSAATRLPTALASKPAGARGRKLARPPAAEATRLADAIRPAASAPSAGAAAANAPTQIAGVGVPLAGAAAQGPAEETQRRAAPAPAAGGNLVAGPPAPVAPARVAAARARPAQPAARPAFRAGDVDDAAARLSGNLRFVEGLALESVKIGPGSLVPGADPARDVVRVVYTDAQGRRLQLDQQRIPLPRDTSRAARDRAVPAPLGMAWGDTLATTGPGGEARLRWLDRSGLWISLSGTVPADSLRALLGRVR